VTDAVPAGTLFSRVERFASIGSTNDEVRAWLLDATPEVCLAVADEQTTGRGRLGRTWTAPPGAALLCSLGFRPTWLEPDRAWRLAATVSLAMCDAAEDTAGLPVGAIRLKWPNDLVIETGGPRALLTGELTPEAAEARLAGPLVLHKLAGVLGETDGLGTDNPRVVVGIGVNADWAREDFPPDIAHTMTSLREASGGRPIDRDALLEAFGARLEGRMAALRTGFFDIAGWSERQATTGRLVTLESGDGSATEPLLAAAVDGTTGALVLVDDEVPGGERHVHAGEVVRVRLVPPAEV
jgi:BirA family biotin operon repressor/biotin-[acetyl-CoA-carboxylase] ligase